MSTSEGTENSARQSFNKLKNKKNNYNMFLPGFLIGVGLHRCSKKYITMEHINASKIKNLKVGPWSGIFVGIIFGSLLHFWSWKKRLILEDLCITEELNERKNIEQHFRRLKAGDDLEKAVVMNYLKNQDNI